MIEYKVGNKVYIATDRYHGNLSEYAEIIVVGRKYAEAVAENGTILKLNMAKNRVCANPRVYNTMGDVFKSKADHDEKCTIEKFAEKIKNTASTTGYSGLRECSVGDLRKIAATLKINLDE